MRKILKQEFFARDARVVARSLLGKYLVRRYRGREEAYRITEVEAYIGPHDKASHAHRGRTTRTEVMFGKPGRFYVYLVYGMYWMLNIVTDVDDYPSAVLIRGVEGIDGPGKVTRVLHIDKRLNTKGVHKRTGLWVEDRGERVRHKNIFSLPRVGVAYAGEWAAKPYRFILKRKS
jgi:DNA-3-methyladenine glycosylase